MIKVVAFDLDNTLYNYTHCNEIAENSLFSKMVNDFEISKEEAGSLLSQAKINIKKQLGNTAASHNRLLYMQTVCELAGKSPLKYAMDFYNTYWNCMLDNMRLYEYVIPLIEELHSKDIKVAIVTDLTAHIQYRKLDRLCLIKYIDIIVTSEEAGEEKPSDKIFKLLLSKANCMPQEILMIGDDLRKDVGGAKEVGIQAVWFEPQTDIKEKVEALL